MIRDHHQCLERDPKPNGEDPEPEEHAVTTPTAYTELEISLHRIEYKTH
ncbi:MAG: hypothetical protein GY856_00915 [bacterium]|nr:hypothetical protein [bacterium]